MMARRATNERGQVIVFFALLFPVIMAIGAIVITIGNWYTHVKHLQTKVDAAAFAGGGVWSFPCASDSDTNANGTGIVDQARLFVGPHTTAGGTVLTAGFNPQIGGVGANDIHVILNGTGWWDDDAGTNPPDFTTPTGSVCDAKILDVRATEANSFPLFSLIPLFPDLKRKARVEIQEVEGLRGLLPISVRVPKPLSAAAVFYDEATGNIEDVRYFREVCTPSDPTCLPGAPPGLGQWTTLDSSGGNWANFNVSEETGIVIAMSFRPACGTPGATPPCFEDAGFVTVSSFCNQAGGIVQCFYSTGSGASQTIQSGLEFIRGYDASPNPDNAPPLVRSAWLDTPSANCGASFSAVTGSCSMTLHADVDIGSVLLPNPPGPPQESRTSANTEVRYKLVYGNTSESGSVCDNWQPACDLSPSWTDSVTVSPQYARHAVAIRVRFKETTVPGFPACGNPGYSANCEWYFTSAGRSTNEPTDAQIFANPVQRSFMGNIDRSGAIKWLRLQTDEFCDGAGAPDYVDGEAMSLPIGSNHCSYLEMGLQGALAKDQDEPPIQLNIGVTSQSAVLDCDPNLPNIKDEIETGCQDPPYAANKFNTTPLCPGASQFFVTPKPAPFDDWAPFDCVLTQTTAAANQIMQGFNLRLFGVSNNPVCPSDPGTLPPPPDGPWERGRNYWHRDNNQNTNYNFAENGVPYGVTDTDPTDNLTNRLLPAEDDPRLVTLFFSKYASFTGSGNETFEVVGFGNFYIAGYGRILGNGSLVIEDPCGDGNDGNLYNGNGNEPPPDLDTSAQGAVAWGHFVKAVTPNPFTIGGNGVLCQPQVSFQPCVAVLVE